MNQRKRKWIVGVILVLAFLIVVGIFYYYYNSKHDGAGSEGTLIMQPRVEALWR